MDFSEKSNEHEQMYPKDVFVAKWLSNEDMFANNTEFNEYPKRRIYHFEPISITYIQNQFVDAPVG